MEINLPHVLAEVSREFARYERSLLANDIPALNDFFWRRQSQTWVRFPGGWRIVAAHVSFAVSIDAQTT
jgi:hypothetical protein